jgi:uncharacterized protein (DUF924 family)
LICFPSQYVLHEIKISTFINIFRVNIVRTIPSMTIEALLVHVRDFHNIWFPPDGSIPRFWFRARDPKYVNQVQAMCVRFVLIVDEATSMQTPRALFDELRNHSWPAEDIITLAVMVDQMPRNALAIGYDSYEGKNPLDVSGNISDTFSIEFAQIVLNSVDLILVQDERVVCFFSLIFRHSHDFQTARRVLGVLKDSNGSLPNLASKFWNETQKREASVKPPSD